MGKITNLLFRDHLSLFKTILLNFKVFGIRNGLKFPILVSRDVKLGTIKRNSIIIDGPIKRFMIRFGFNGSSDLTYFNPRQSYLSIEKDGCLLFHGNATFAPHNSIMVSGGKLEFGADFFSNNGNVFSCVNHISFGSECLLGGNITIRDSDGHKVFDKNILPNDVVCSGEIIIGNHVWICNKCDILKNVTILSDSVVSYNSLVLKPIDEPNVLIAGHPATIKKHDIEWVK